MSASRHKYAGSELEIFLHARKWKRYWAGLIQPFLRGDVLEVGAGIGANTPLLAGPAVRSWFCLEPDEFLARCVLASVRDRRCEVVASTIDGVVPADRFDAILYIDVLEHIGEDAHELEKAALRLRPAGVLIVLAPAHQWLYSPFDKSIGHHRRYSRRALAALTPTGLALKSIRYLDSVGLVLSLANRVILRASTPTAAQIQFWDRRVVPMSRVLDGLTGYMIGKSVLAVWEKRG